jgi:hypothetical protein
MTALAWFRRFGLRAGVRAVATTAGAALVLFHLWLFAGRLRDFSIVEPSVLASWLASAALGLFALFLKRRGLPLASGRSGLVFWLLVLLLHIGMMGMTPVALELPTVEQTLALGLQLAGAALAVAAIVAGAADDALASRVRAFERATPRRARTSGSRGPLSAPRPPPSR